MPNHVHGIILLTHVGAGLRPAQVQPEHRGLPEIVRAFKSFSSRRINESGETRRLEVWQRGYYDHIIRNEKSLNLIRVYIRTNPLLWNYDPDNPAVLPTDDDLLLTAYGFNKDELEFVRNYLDYRRTRSPGGSQTRPYKR